MGRLRVAFEGFGRSLSALFSRSREPGPVADVEVEVVAGGGGAGAAASGPGAGVGGEPPSFRNRARLRRRLRYLRQTRELGFRDLGGFLFDSNRFGRERDDIVKAKLDGLNAIDRELRALELALDDAQDVTLLREPGISVCPRCGALHGSEDNYCPACGLPVGRGLGLAIAQGGPGGAVTVAPSGGAAGTDGAPASAPPAPGTEVSTPPAPATPGEDDAGAKNPASRRRAAAKAGDSAADDSSTADNPSAADDSAAADASSAADASAAGSTEGADGSAQSADDAPTSETSSVAKP